MSLLNWMQNKWNKNRHVRIEEIKPYQKGYEINTPTVWFSNSNIENCIQAVSKKKIQHIHLQTTSISFLNDDRLKNITGLTIQYEQKDLSPLMNLNQLTHLSLPEGVKGPFDFSLFPNLIYIGGQLPNNYINFETLKDLKYTHLYGYRKLDFSDFSNLHNLKKLQIYSANAQSLQGLSNLSNLRELILEKCPKLETTEGISKDNIKLETVRLDNCKRLRDLTSLGELTNLKKLMLFKINEIESFKFLNELQTLEELYVHPSDVRVMNSDFYPLVNKLKGLELLDHIGDWKPLQDYLENKVLITNTVKEPQSELKQILKNLSLRNWTNKLQDGLEVYTKENCNKGIAIFSTLIDNLEKDEKMAENNKINLIKESIESFNQLNKELEYGFIETGEREELCEIFDNIADAVGINVQDYNDGIASEWREW